jgi:pimeloyl-ACP methyl ester carboxylesterase
VQDELKEPICMTSAESSARIETLNGEQIYFEVHGTGEPLLLLHGFSGSSQDWLTSKTGWGKQFQLIVPDLRARVHPNGLCAFAGVILRRFSHSGSPG